MFNYGSVGQNTHSWYFPAVFHQKSCVFIISFFFFCLLSIELPPQNIHQSETGIGDKKLSWELYVRIVLRRFQDQELLRTYIRKTQFLCCHKIAQLKH